MFPQVLFLLSCTLLHYSYEILDRDFLSQSTSYCRLPADKRVYVVKNVLKGVYLGILFIASLYFVVPRMLINQWDNTILQSFASMYVSNDIVGLYRVKLHTSTRLHHMTAAAFLMGAWCVNFENSTTAKMLCTYTLFSCATFPVNLYLGLRFIHNVNEGFMKKLFKWAKNSYTICCILNWIIQMQMAYDNKETFLMAYLAGLTLIIYDDIILLRWFYKNN